MVKNIAIGMKGPAAMLPLSVRAKITNIKMELATNSEKN